MRSKIKAGTTSLKVPIYVQDSSKTDGSGLGSLTSATSGLVGEYRRDGASSWTSITLTSATLGTFTSGGWVADGSLTGAYEVGIPNAAVASGAAYVQVRFRGAANMLPVLLYIELDAVDYQDAIRFGLTALPTAAPGSASGLIAFGTGTGQINPSSGAVPTSDGLKPTTAGRTLDVSATGEAGIDWANIGSPTTTVNFSGTTVAQLSGDVAGKVLGGGVSTITGTGARVVDSSGNAVAPASTALSTATWTGTRAGYLDNLSAGAVALASGVSVASGGITTASFAAGAINAAAIAADAIGASELAADAVSEIVTGVLTTAVTESYHTDGSPPTVAQALCFLISALTEFSISGTTITMKKLDGSTTAATLTINSSTTPTSVTRAS